MSDLIEPVAAGGRARAAKVAGGGTTSHASTRLGRSLLARSSCWPR